MRKEIKMNISSKLLGLAKEMSEEIKKDKIDPTPPPFFEEPGKDKQGNYKVETPPDPGQRSAGKKTLPKDAEELERGVSAIDVLANAAEEGTKVGERTVVEFEDERQMASARQILSEDPDIGHPTYELGPDGKSWIFHPWKAEEGMKGRIKAAIKLLKDKGLADVRQYAPER